MYGRTTERITAGQSKGVPVRDRKAKVLAERLAQYNAFSVIKLVRERVGAGSTLNFTVGKLLKMVSGKVSPIFFNALLWVRILLCKHCVIPVERSAIEFKSLRHRGCCLSRIDLNQMP